MLTKQQFVDFVNRYVKLYHAVENINKAMKELDSDFMSFGVSGYETLIVDTLKAAMNDTTAWIDYWMYDLDFGRKWKRGMITDKTKKDIKLKTVEDLYDILNKEYLEGK